MRFILFVLIVGWVITTQAQDFKDQFNQFKTGNEKAYDKAMRQQDSIFAKSIVDNWRAFSLQEPEIKVQEEPKPQKQPVADLDFQIKEILHKILESGQPKLMRSFNQPKLEVVEEYNDFELEQSYSFHGESINLRYSGSFLKADEIHMADEDGLAQAWQTLSRSAYQVVVKSLYDKKEELKLPDYGYLLLIESFLSELDLSDTGKEVYKWFLLSKSGYTARVGLIDQQPVLVIGSYGKIYGKRYFSLGGVNYYILSDRAGQFESYQVGANDNENLFDFSLRSEIKLPLEPTQKQFNYEAKNGDNISLSFYYNNNMVKLLNQFPQSDLVYYLSSSSSDLLKKSVQKTFHPHLEGLSVMDQVLFLLEFVQKAFEYQSDAIQFGKERVMYPEEMFDRPFADCDDRVVLLSYLLRTFTDLPMVAVAFPQHVALAVRLPSPTYGETINYQGYTFTFCDPTYFNAPLGSVIPQADRSKMEVIEF
ncbi:MAG: hypothetical protein ACJA08_002323 [Cyclobacteriaceae bacterium]|jgi:hypothetical protein